MGSDGHGHAHGRAEFTSTSDGLAKGVLELSLSLEMKATIRESRARQGGRTVSDHYRVRFTPTMPVVLSRARRTLRPACIEQRPEETSLRTARRLISEIQDAGMRTTRQISVNSPWGMTLAGRQMLPALVRRVNIP